MFSLLFFLFVAFVLVMGFIAVTTVHRKKGVGKPVDNGGVLKRDEDKSATRSDAQNIFREGKGSRIKGNILPTDSKRSDGNSRDQSEAR